MKDIWTMIWKEWRDLLFRDGGWFGQIRPLLILVMIGIFYPLKVGLEWLQLSLLQDYILFWIPFFMIIMLVADSIAGERERHTLETLLASRMTDWAILLGKIIILVLYSWILIPICLLMAFILVNMFKNNGPMAYYPLGRLSEVLLLGFVLNIFAACVGVIVSLHAPSVRQAQQTLSIGTMVVLVGGGLLAVQVVGKSLLGLDLNHIFPATLTVFVILDCLLFAVALLFFQRSKLILS